MAISPTDQSYYVGPPITKNTIGPNYPRWMAHPTLDSVIVADEPTEVALVATDTTWLPATGPALTAGTVKFKHDKK